MNAHYSNILLFWRAFEAFNLPSVPEPKRAKGTIVTILNVNDPLPWEEATFFNSNPGKKWKHTLYIYCIPKEHVIHVLRNNLSHPGEAPPESLRGDTCLAALVVDQAGNPLEKTYVRSSFAYGIRALVKGTSFDEINKELKKAYEDYLIRFQLSPEGAKEHENIVDEEYEEYQDFDGVTTSSEEDEIFGIPVTWAQLEKELDDLQTLFPFLLKESAVIKCISEEIRENVTPEAPFLNSFYSNDLNKLIEYVAHNKHICASLSAYLKSNIIIEGRFDLQQKRIIQQCLNPGFQSPGRWPSNPSHGLYSAQLAALNITLSRLRENGEGLMGINGPPGTGKTTLLKEVIVDIIVNRAKRLLKANVHKLFNTRRNQIAGPAGYYEINTSIFGDDGILVASNNNKAVENISKELPLIKSIHKETFTDARYFKDFACKVSERPDCWALISAVLGNSTNCFNFSNKFWFNNGFGDYLTEEYKGGHEKQHERDYEEVAAELKDYLDQYEDFRKIAIEYHEDLNRLLFKKKVNLKKHQELKNILITEYGIEGKQLIDENFEHLTIEEIHKLNPYSSPFINKLRSEIFLKSLELHVCAINANAKFFRSNLDLFLNMLTGKHADLINEDITLQLWNTFFFCIPVVSTTLASIERLFNKLNAGSLGWLLLDEAGQATPQSSCGAIWRSKRCIIIGDTLQIPPVVTMPEGLGKMLQQSYNVRDDSWSPIYSSTQFLADRTTEFGTTINVNNNEIWTGFPLRAHRRCDEPMFSIANTIAYNNQMVKATIDDPFDVVLGKSAWINVTGKFNNGHIIREEIQKLQQMLGALLASGHDKAIFVISPFKSVADECSQTFGQYKTVECGTIHTFQGQETDIVFIVLGSNPTNSRAREWVAQSPNMLNVAITRAKKRVYVIGNIGLWSKCKYFNNLEALLKQPQSLKNYQ